MKICYIASSESILTKRWLEYFVKANYEVHLISKIPVLWEGVKFHQLDLNPPENMIPFFKQISNLKKLIRKINPDILHAHYVTDHGIYGALSGFSPFILSVWGCDILCPICENPCLDRPIYPIFKTLLLKFAIAKAHLIFGNSKKLMDGAIYWGARESKCHIIRWGVELDKFKFKDKSLIKKRLGWDDCPVVVSHRGLESYYNIDILIEAVPLCLKEIPEAKILIMNDGSCLEKLKLQARRLGVLDSIRFIGYLDYKKALQYLSIGDVCISIPSSDSFANSLIEAMILKVPLILTDLSAYKEFIKDGWNGFFVPVKDEKALAEKIIYLLKNKELMKQFGEKSYKLIKEEANYYKHMNRVENLYEELYAKKRSC